MPSHRFGSQNARTPFSHKCDQSLLLSNYDFDRYITEEDSKPHKLSNLHLQFTSSSLADEAQSIVDVTKTMCAGSIIARDLTNERSDVANPEALSEWSRELSKKHGLRFEQVVGDHLLEHNMNLIHAVGRSAR